MEDVLKDEFISPFKTSYYKNNHTTIREESPSPLKNMTYTTLFNQYNLPDYMIQKSGKKVTSKQGRDSVLGSSRNRGYDSATPMYVKAIGKESPTNANN